MIKKQLAVGHTPVLRAQTKHSSIWRPLTAPVRSPRSTVAGSLESPSLSAAFASLERPQLTAKSAGTARGLVLDLCWNSRHGFSAPGVGALLLAAFLHRCRRAKWRLATHAYARVLIASRMLSTRILEKTRESVIHTRVRIQASLFPRCVAVPLPHPLRAPRSLRRSPFWSGPLTSKSAGAVHGV